jgi:hypothetical protein
MNVYEPGNRPRCIVCFEELSPAPSERDGEPTFSGFLPCPDHPNADVIYNEGVTAGPPAPAIAVTLRTSPRSPRALHNLKTWPRWFVPAWVGYKRFELRNNDRGFRAGDLIILEEYDPERKCRSGGAKGGPCEDVCLCRYTGRQIQGKITYVLPGGAINGLPGEGGLGSGWCVFGYIAISKTKSP